MSFPVDTATEIQLQVVTNAPNCNPLSPERNLGVVAEIVDGDTKKVLIDGQIYPVRYIGIDLPETKDPKQYLKLETIHKVFVIWLQSPSSKARLPNPRWPATK
jgi:endonuclease YncB( thermonuclease family)